MTTASNMKELENMILGAAKKVMQKETPKYVENWYSENKEELSDVLPEDEMKRIAQESVNVTFSNGAVSVNVDLEKFKDRGIDINKECMVLFGTGLKNWILNVFKKEFSHK